MIFSYVRDGVEMLDAPEIRDGKFARIVGPAATHPLAADTITLPFANPWKSLFFVGDHDFLPNGDGVICTITGEVWTVSGLDDKLEHLRWRRFATGLIQPLGLRVVDGLIHVLGRDQITRLHDLNGDGEADFLRVLFQCVRHLARRP